MEKSKWVADLQQKGPREFLLIGLLVMCLTDRTLASLSHAHESREQWLWVEPVRVDF